MTKQYVTSHNLTRKMETKKNENYEQTKAIDRKHSRRIRHRNTSSRCLSTHDDSHYFYGICHKKVPHNIQSTRTKMTRKQNSSILLSLAPHLGVLPQPCTVSLCFECLIITYRATGGETFTYKMSIFYGIMKCMPFPKTHDVCTTVPCYRIITFTMLPHVGITLSSLFPPFELWRTNTELLLLQFLAISQADMFLHD